MRHLERVSKTAATASVLLILTLILAVHPDMTWTLRAISIAALVAGWFTASPSRSLIQIWILIATLAPAFLRLLAGREGPVLDIVWMAGLTGALLRIVSWSRWSLPPLWSVLLGGWALTLSISWPVLVAREIDFHWSGFFDSGATNSWSLMTAPQVAAWILYIVLAQLLGALWFEWAHGAFRDRDRGSRIVHALWIGATVASVVAIVQGTVNMGLLSTEFWASLRRTTGTMLDANAYGVSAALAAPISFLGMRMLATRMPAASVAVLAINWIGLWMSGSRTALLCAMLGTMGLIVGLWRERHAAPQSRRTLAMGIPIAGLAIAAVIFIAPTIGPIQRALDIPIGRAGLSALWNRGGYGPIALRMTRDYPLTGVGIGSYRVIAPDYWRAMANDALPLDNAQNWWRHQIAELGVLGGALIIGFSILVAWRVVTGRAVPYDIATSSTVRGLLIGLGATSLLGMPTQNPLVLLWFFSLLAWFAALVPERETIEARDARMSAAWAVAFGLALAYAGGHVLLARGSLRVIDRAQRAHREYVLGAYAPEPLPNGNEFRWTTQDARFLWPVKTRWLVVRFWANHPDIATRPVHVTLTSPCGVLFDEALTSPSPMSVGITLPEGQESVKAFLHLSRTWKPSDQGEDDQRALGLGIVADFTTNPTLALEQHRTVKVSSCGAGI